MVRNIASSLSRLGGSDVTSRMASVGRRVASRFHNTGTLEQLEGRTMMSLLGVAANYEQIAISGSGSIEYDAATSRLSAVSVPVRLFLSPTQSAAVLPARSFDLELNVDVTGDFVSGIAGNDLTVTGRINGFTAGLDINGDSVVDINDNVNGTLITGEVKQFGWAEGGSTDAFDFRIIPTGGLVAGLWNGFDIGLRLASSTASYPTPFNGSFATSWKQQAEGFMGQTGKLSSIAGFVYEDDSNEGNKDGGEAGIGGVQVTLTGINGLNGEAVNLTTFTNPDGSYYFGDLTEGTYTIYESQPVAYIDGIDTQGTPGSGTAGNDVFSTITLPANFNGVNNNFGEITPVTGVTLLKLTNNTDNDSAPGLLVGAGSAVTWTYTVTNTGNNPLTSVVVTDDNGTAGDTSDDFTATYASGDTNSNGLLDTTETWNFTAPGTAIAGQYSNTAIVNAVDSYSNPSDAQAVDNYFASAPGINLVKLTNSTDNNTAPGLLVANGAGVTWTYVVTNTGNYGLWYVTVSDDNGTPGDVSDDFNAVLDSGDGNFNNILDTDETWYFTASDVAKIGQYSNTAIVTGLDPLDNQVTDTDVDNYYGVKPGINLVKLTNGTDNNSGTGPIVAVGSTVNWSYTVTNTGNVELSNVSITDDNGTAGTGDDFNPVYVSGDTDSDNKLDTSETWTFSASAAAVVGQYVNYATVSGTSPLNTVVQSTDNDRYFAANPGINLVKLTNGTDNNSGTGPTVAVGSTVNWTYTVTNTGNVELSNVSIVDDNGTAGTGDDFAPTYVSGDTDSDLKLDTSETWTFSASAAAVVGQYINYATVTGTSPLNTNVQSTDNDRYNALAPKGSISGTKFEDLSGNGLSNDDAPLGGVTIQLYNDVDNSGTFTTGDTLVTSAVTSTGVGSPIGTYSFGDLNPGRYIVREVTPTGYLQTGPVSGFYSVTIGSGTEVTNRDFANFELGCKCAIESFYFIINGTTVVSNLRGNTNAGDLVTAVFTIKAGWEQTLSLVSYTAPEPYFNSNTASQQKIFDLATGTFSGGATGNVYTMTVQIPNSNYQVDLVCGLAIDQLGPAGSNIFYTPQQRLLSADNDGNGAVLANGSSIAGAVYVDTSNDGVRDGSEVGIGFATVRLTGTTVNNQAVSLNRLTKPDGSFIFDNLVAGTYRLTEVQPANVADGKDTAGSLGGNASANDVISNIILPPSVKALGYNFGERLACTLGSNTTAGVSYWTSSTGQSLIRCLNGSSNSTNLANWLFNRYGKLFNTLQGKKNSDVASLINSLNNNGRTLEAQILSVALSAYVTSTTLAQNAGSTRGFATSSSGVGVQTFRLGDEAVLLGLNTGGIYTINQILTAANSKASNGTLFSGKTTNRNEASVIFTAILASGSI
jgi:hypothetical protein